jgi:hypothetical protein
VRYISQMKSHKNKRVAEFALRSSGWLAGVTLTRVTETGPNI